MGYSLFVRAQSLELANKMLAFLGTEYRSWPQLRSLKTEPQTSGPKNISEHHRHPNVGIQYGMLMGGERFYMYSFVNWLALKIGACKRRFNRDSVNPSKLEKPVPFTIYDNYQSWPVIVVTSDAEHLQLPETLRYWACDPYGISWDLSQHTLLLLHDAPNVDVRKVMAQAGKESGPQDEGWGERNVAAIYRIAKEPLDAFADEIRQELKRLDTLWRAL